MSQISMADARSFASELVQLCQSNPFSKNVVEAAASKLTRFINQRVGKSSTDPVISEDNKKSNSETTPIEMSFVKTEGEARDIDRLVIGHGIEAYRVIAAAIHDCDSVEFRDDTSDYLLSTIGATFSSMVNCRSLDQNPRKAIESLRHIAIAATEIIRRMGEDSPVADCQPALRQFSIEHRPSDFTIELRAALKRHGLK